MTLRRDSKLARLLNFIHIKLLLNYDYFIVISGEEGVGKSRGLFLNIADHWYTKILGQPLDKDCYGVDFKDFINSLKDGKPLDFRGLDEAGDTLDSQDYANRMNKILYQTFTIVRERRYFTCIVLPSLFDLNSRFRKRRVRLLLHAKQRIDNKCRVKKCATSFVGSKCPKCGGTNFKRGYVIYDCWGKKKIQRILEINSRRYIKSLYCGVSPTFTGTVAEYKGGLLERYNKLKVKKVEDAFKGLDVEVQEMKQKSTRPSCVKCGRSSLRFTKNYIRCVLCDHKEPKSKDKDIPQ